MLVDGEIGPTKLDLQMLDWLRAERLPHTVIATKHDKVKASKREQRKRDLAEACELLDQATWCGSARHQGRHRPPPRPRPRLAEPELLGAGQRESRWNARIARGSVIAVMTSGHRIASWIACSAGQPDVGTPGLPKRMRVAVIVDEMGFHSAIVPSQVGIARAR